MTQKAEQMIQGNHYNSELVRSIAENVTARWQQLMYHAEERLKLVMASMNWFKTAEQVSLWHKMCIKPQRYKCV